MDLDHLRYFRTIVEIGSTTAAAKKLGVAQPTLTSAVKKLEEQTGSTLLLRNARGVSVTPTGAALAHAASEVLAMLDETVERIRGLDHHDEGRFVIGCHESLGAYFLPEFMHGFLGAAPRIELTLWNGTSADVREAVLRRDVHFGLVVNPLPHDELVLVEAFRDAVAVVGRADRLASGPDATLALLREGPLVFASRVEQCRQIVDALGGLGVLPQRLIETGDLELTKSLILAGVGVGILPRRVAAYGRDGALVVLDDALPQIADRIVMCWRADSPRTVAWTRTKDALLEHARKLEPIPAARA
jgi:DNA-binding transcriptional LysR family regulator